MKCLGLDYSRKLFSKVVLIHFKQSLTPNAPNFVDSLDSPSPMSKKCSKKMEKRTLLFGHVSISFAKNRAATRNFRFRFENHQSISWSCFELNFWFLLESPRWNWIVSSLERKSWFHHKTLEQKILPFSVRPLDLVSRKPFTW